MVEREEFANSGKHECGRIKDPKYVVTEDMVLKVGKKKFVSIKIK